MTQAKAHEHGNPSVFYLCTARIVQVDLHLSETEGIEADVTDHLAVELLRSLQKRKRLGFFSMQCENLRHGRRCLKSRYAAQSQH
jgi:hypothetical protein